MNNLLAFNSWQNLILYLVVAIIVTAIIVFLAKRFVTKQVTYEKKLSLLTPLEKQYYYELSKILGEHFILLPQVNLASVINKTSSGYRTELFRNADFGVFDHNLRPILLIEINDATHLRPDRAQRDESVKNICKKAKLPLVTFWTKDGINRDEMTRVLRKYL